jgi:hypothetical protein
LKAICPDGFEYRFEDEEFVVGRDLRPSLGEEEPKLFTLKATIPISLAHGFEKTAVGFPRSGTPHISYITNLNSFYVMTLIQVRS